MKKTLTINLADFLFNIDEDAYELLNNYINKLKASFANSSDSTEIIADVESRIAELFINKATKEAAIISILEVEAVIAQLGQPEDFIEEANQTIIDSNNSKDYKSKFYRDKEHKLIGGVCAGIAAYFNTDALFLRLAFAFSVIFFGTGILIYLVLWALIPEARTLAQKLEMRGKPITIKDIEANVKQEVKDFANNIEKHNVIKNLSTGIKSILNFVFKIVGFFANISILFFSFIFIIGTGLVVSYFLGFNFPYLSTPAPLAKLCLPFNYTYIALTIGLVAAIPFLGIIVACLKKLFKINISLRYFNLTCLVLWGIGVIFAIDILTGSISEFEVQSTSRSIVSVPQNTDTLSVSVNKMIDEWEEHNTNFNEEFYFSNDSLYYTSVAIKIQATENDSFKVTILKRSQGKNKNAANVLATDVIYNYSLENDKLSLSNTLALPPKSAYRGQQVDIIIDVPKNKSIKLDKSLEYMIESAPIATDTMYYSDMPGKTWLMTNDGLVQKK